MEFHEPRPTLIANIAESIAGRPRSSGASLGDGGGDSTPANGVVDASRAGVAVVDASQGGQFVVDASQ